MNARSLTQRTMGRIVAVALGATLVVGAPALAQSETTRGTVLREGVSDTYVVQKGDTLWDISARFLRDPWLWPEIWQVNPDIENPHLIYPGDIIRLIMVDGQPRLVVERPRGPDKLSPRVRELPLEAAIPTIPLEAIRPFLGRPAVVSADEFANAPYILEGFDGRLMSGLGHRVYVRGVGADPALDWTVVRKGKMYKDPATGEELGYEAEFIGEAEITRLGDPATAVLTASTKEALAGDRLLVKSATGLSRALQPHAPDTDISGHIVAQIGGAEQIGQYGVIVLNRGATHGLDPGSVVSIWRAGGTTRDRVGGGKVQLPDERYGEALVFRTDGGLSYALVMRSTRELAVGDMIRNP